MSSTLYLEGVPMTTFKLGVDPRAEIKGIRRTNGSILLRTKIGGRTQRYIACFTSSQEFKFYREITSSERKRVVKKTLRAHPLETLPWILEDGSNKWSCILRGEVLTTLAPAVLKAPTDYSVYMWGQKIYTKNQILQEVVCV